MTSSVTSSVPPDAWRRCVHWLASVHMLPPQHQLTTADAVMRDLALELRNGVLLCLLLNRLKPNSLDPKLFSQRPQESQYLCKKNIRAFLETCKTGFRLNEGDLFETQDLLDMQNLAKTIYDSIMDPRLLHNTTSTPTPATETTKRKSLQEQSVEELISTEKTYIKVVLKPIVKPFMRTLVNFLPRDQFDKIFFGFEELRQIHSQFCKDLESKASDVKQIAACVVSFKDKLLIYGPYCANVTSATHLLVSLCERDKGFNMSVENCEMEANGRQYSLHNLLVMPSQRILKYHLLMKQLLDNTPEDRAEERITLQAALDAMLDLSLYINEWKRDSEALQTINDLEFGIRGFQMPQVLLCYFKPQDTHFRDYGHLLLDGELKVRMQVTSKNTKLVQPAYKDCNRYIFLFDRLMLICKCQNNDTYHYKEYLQLANFNLKFLTAFESSCNCFILERSPVAEDDKNVCYIFTSKTEELCSKWVECIRLAKEIIQPPGAVTEKHHFIIKTFSKPTICAVCKKLLLGVFCQGYICKITEIVAHKECIPRAAEIHSYDGQTKVVPKLPPRPVRAESPNPARAKLDKLQKSRSSGRPSIGRVRAKADYSGSPRPSVPMPLISFKKSDVFDLLFEKSEVWWEGRIGTVDGVDAEGFFPSNLVSIIRRTSDPDTPTLPPLRPLKMGGSMDEPAALLMQRPRRDTEPNIAPSPSPAGPPIPAPRRPPQQIDSSMLEIFPWFIGLMNRLDASCRLDSLPNGSFLVRISPDGLRKGEPALSVIYDTVQHITISVKPNGQFSLDDHLLFNSLPDMITYYEMNSLGVTFPEVPTALLLPYKVAEAQKRVSGSTDHKIIGHGFARYDFVPDASDTNQISLFEGDPVSIISKSNDSKGWWKGSARGKVGFFPRDYIKETHDKQ